MFKTLLESFVLGFKGLVEKVLIEGYFSRKKGSPPNLPRYKVVKIKSRKGMVTRFIKV